MCVVTGYKRGKERMEGVGEAVEGGVRRPQKSIGWEERAEIICAVKGQRGSKSGVEGGDRARHRESTKMARDRTDNRPTVEKVRTMNQGQPKKKREKYRRKYSRKRPRTM